MQLRIIEQGLRLYVIDASRVAQEVGLRGRTNTVLQTCFFAISGVLPRDQAIDHIKQAISKTYGGKGDAIVRGQLSRGRRHAGAAVRGRRCRKRQPVDGNARRWCRSMHRHSCATSPPRCWKAAATKSRSATCRWTAPGRPAPRSGRSATSPRRCRCGTRTLCIQCGQCSFVCPHGVIQAKYFDGARLDGAPAASGRRRSMCAASPTSGSRWISPSRIAPAAGCASRPARWCRRRRSSCRTRYRCWQPSHADNAFFAALPVNDRARVDFANVRGVQFLEPLFASPVPAPAAARRRT